MLEISYAECWEIDIYPFDFPEARSVPGMLADFEEIKPNKLVWFQGSEHPDGTDGWVYISATGSCVHRRIHRTTHHWYYIPTMLWSADYHLIREWPYQIEKDIKWQKHGF